MEQTLTMQHRPEPRELILGLLRDEERTVRWVALKVGCSPSHLHRVLQTGERPLTGDMARAIASLFAVPVETFLGGDA